MAGNSFGKNFIVTTFGESYSKGLGVVIDGCPSGITFDYDILDEMISRRKPNSKYNTTRIEKDGYEILSGIYNNITLGTPICIVFKNENFNSDDYENIKDIYRPGHADYTYDAKYRYRDYRGGGRSSGRETLARVAAGAVAKMILARYGFEFLTFTESIGEVFVSDDNFNASEIYENSLFMPSNDVAKEAIGYLDEIQKQDDSVGGMVQCLVKGAKKGLGEPVFDKLDAVLSSAIMSIGSIKAIEIGEGIEAAVSLGSKWNDEFDIKDNCVVKNTNNCGGILGGISDSDIIKLRAYVKPTPSISKSQNSINKDYQKVSFDIAGRHDVCIVPRACVVIESMVAITLVDLLLRNSVSSIDSLDKIY